MHPLTPFPALLIALASIFVTYPIAPAQAVTLSGNASGAWEGLPATTFGVTTTNAGSGTNNLIDWGTPFDNSFTNLLRYDGRTFSGIGIDQNTPSALFQIGDVFYRNGTVSGSSTNFGLPTPTPFSLAVSLTFNEAGVPNQAFDFDFELTTVPNTQTPPDDILTFTSSSSPDTFTLDGTDYTLELFGFSQDGGNSLTNTLILEEDLSDTVGLYARITAAPPPPLTIPTAPIVPTPPTIPTVPEVTDIPVTPIVPTSPTVPTVPEVTDIPATPTIPVTPDAATTPTVPEPMSVLSLLVVGGVGYLAKCRSRSQTDSNT